MKIKVSELIVRYLERLGIEYIFGKGGLQESSGEGGRFDQVTLFKSITRYSKTVERTDYLPQVMIQASKALLSSKPGPDSMNAQAICGTNPC